MPDKDAIRQFGLLLTNGFALMSYASLVEPFRAANILAGTPLYRWQHISIDGRPVAASNGASIIADCAVGDALDCDTLFVFAAGDPARFSDEPTFAWLREIARQGATIGGVSGGPFLLARAGLLDGHRATIHWDHQAAFAERFPTVSLTPGLYVIDRRRVTCAGGTAGLDLALELIERERGHVLAAKVSDWFIRTEIRGADKPQRLSLRDRYAITNDRVLKALAHMEATVEEPACRSELARIGGVSVRQLERLFLHQLGETMNQAYLRIRLTQAEELVRKTGLSVTMIALACGFRNSGHFSRAFKARFGHPPSRYDAG